ncbi:MAG TPA: hypothetical protein VLY23_02515 [Candidatus Acidoferrum sp.]|nr:hypothetical protein [Candidatus Acidoferrum sp.]
MNILRKTVGIVGSITLLALLLAALAPRAARGVAAALVQVTNTSSNPVPTADDSTNFPFLGTACFSTLSGCGGAYQSGFTVPTTTSTGVRVKRLVIEEVSTYCDTTSNNFFSISVQVSTPEDHSFSSGALRPEFIFIPQAFGLLGDLSGGAQPARIYAEPGSTVTAAGLGGLTDPLDCTTTMSGHLTVD